MSKSWLKGIRRGSESITGVGGSNLGDITTAIKNADSGVPSLNDAIGGLDFKQVGDEIHVGDARWRDVEPSLRVGDITKAFDDMGVSHTISAADEASLKNLLGPNSPDISIKSLENKQLVAKKYHEDIDVEAGSGVELAAKLDKRSKEKVTSMYTKLKKAAGVAAIGAGIFTTIFFTANMWQDISQATNARNGCFLAYKDTATTACKLINRTCGYGELGDPPCSTEQVNSLDFNIYLMVADIIDRTDNTAISALTGLGLDLGDNTIDGVLSIPTNIPILVDYYKVMYPTNNETFDACTLGGIAQGCVSCNASLATNSVFYASDQMLEGNFTLKCITNTTVLDTFVDVSTEMGVEIFDALGDSISGSFRGNFFVIIGIILVLVIIVALVLKFKPASTSKNTSVSGGVPLNQSGNQITAQPMAPPQTMVTSQTMLPQQSSNIYATQ